MAERLSLLTMIIIGEGVIGSTKTAGALWPTTSNPSVGGVISIVCIIIMLVSTGSEVLSDTKLMFSTDVNVATILR